MRILAFFMVASAVWAQGGPANEALLLERVEQFWKAFEEKKYRKADALVLEDDKDAFFVWPKKEIFNLGKSEVRMVNDGKMAQVLTTLETDEFMVGIGKMRIPRQILTHWKFVDDNWWWFQPETSIIEGPFGKWDYGRKAGDGSAQPVSVAAAISMGPKFEELQKMVTPDKTQIRFDFKKGGTETIEFSNKMPGAVKLILDTPPFSEFDIKVDPVEIPREASGVVIVKYTPGKEDSPLPVRPGTYDLRITVAQTGKTHVIRVTLE
jgi:hypothetical protein